MWCLMENVYISVFVATVMYFSGVLEEISEHVGVCWRFEVSTDVFYNW